MGRKKKLIKIAQQHRLPSQIWVRGRYVELCHLIILFCVFIRFLALSQASETRSVPGCSSPVQWMLLLGSQSPSPAGFVFVLPVRAMRHTVAKQCVLQLGLWRGGLGCPAGEQVCGHAAAEGLHALGEAQLSSAQISTWQSTHPH